jgi:hypothetical protein
MMENPLEVFKRGFYYEINSLPRLRVSLASQMLVFNLKKNLLSSSLIFSLGILGSGTSTNVVLITKDSERTIRDQIYLP